MDNRHQFVDGACKCGLTLAAFEADKTLDNVCPGLPSKIMGIPVIVEKINEVPNVTNVTWIANTHFLRSVEGGKLISACGQVNPTHRTETVSLVTCRACLEVMGKCGVPGGFVNLKDSLVSMGVDMAEGKDKTGLTVLTYGGKTMELSNISVIRDNIFNKEGIVAYTRWTINAFGQWDDGDFSEDSTTPLGPLSFKRGSDVVVETDSPDANNGPYLNIAVPFHKMTNGRLGSVITAFACVVDKTWTDKAKDNPNDGVAAYQAVREREKAGEFKKSLLTAAKKINAATEDQKASNERRWKLYCVSEIFFKELFHFARYPFFHAPCFPDLPADAKIVDVWEDRFYRSIVVRVQSSSFEPVQDGAKTPYAEGILNVEWKLVEKAMPRIWYYNPADPATRREMEQAAIAAADQGVTLLIPKPGIVFSREEIVGALARGYCTEANQKETVDSDLIESMADEIEKMLGG